MRTAYILHGRPDKDEYLDMDFPSPSNAHWIPWLQQKFLRNGILCQALEMPVAYAPVYESWAETFAQAQIKDDSIIVAHSAGAGFILKWLFQNPSIRLSKLILVAPWSDPQKNHGDCFQSLLPEDLEKRIGEIHIFYSTDEPVLGVAETKEKLIAAYPSATLHTHHNMRHFCIDDTGPTFEPLWKICE